MIKFLLIFIMAIPFAQAQYFGDDDSLLIYEEDVNVRSLNTTAISLETKQKIEKPTEYTVDSYNSKNIMTFFIGVQQDEFEQKNNFFVRSITPAFDFRFHRRVTTWLGAEFDFQLSKNAIIPRQSLLIGTGFNSNTELYALIQLGEKIALNEQVNSGYLFVNLGLGIKKRLFTNHSIDLRAYSNASSFSRYGFETRYLYQVNKSEVGLYFGVEEYNPYNLEYERQGQSSSRFGLLFSY